MKKVKISVHPQAIESLKRYHEDVHAGHKGGAEYWRGSAAAYFTANPRLPTDYKIFIERYRDGHVVMWDNTSISWTSIPKWEAQGKSAKELKDIFLERKGFFKGKHSQLNPLDNIRTLQRISSSKRASFVHFGPRKVGIDPLTAQVLLALYESIGHGDKSKFERMTNSEPNFHKLVSYAWKNESI